MPAYDLQGLSLQIKTIMTDEKVVLERMLCFLMGIGWSHGLLGDSVQQLSCTLRYLDIGSSSSCGRCCLISSHILVSLSFFNKVSCRVPNYLCLVCLQHQGQGLTTCCWAEIWVWCIFLSGKSEKGTAYQRKWTCYWQHTPWAPIGVSSITQM